MTDDARGIRCFSCMAKLSNAGERCPRCGWDNRVRVNDDDMLSETVLRDQYLVGRALGRGGFGVTYMGFDLNLNHRVAIKEYFPSMAAYRYSDGVTVRPRTNSANEYSEGLERAFREAQTVANLGRIPNIVQVYNVFQANGTVYIVMDYVEGTTLYRMVKQNGPMGWRQALELLYPIMRVLEKVHARGVIHRDVSPDNIMLDQKTNETVLLDFGAAREEDAALTVILKPGFAPFEQYNRSEWKDGRTDEYALCATMYYLLTGRPPESADKRILMENALKTPRTLGSDVPANVEAVLLKGMSVRADDRYESVAALRSAFERAEKGQDGEDRHDSENTVALKDWWEERRVPETAPMEEQPAYHGPGAAGGSAARTEPPEGKPLPRQSGEDKKPDTTKKRGAVPGVVKGILVLLILIVGLNVLNAFNIVSLENLAGRLPDQVAGILLPSESMKRRGDQQAGTAGTEKETADLSARENTPTATAQAPTATAQAPSSSTEIQTGEISDSWEEILTAIDDGSAKQRYAVGATKALDLGSLGMIYMQLAGFNLDERSDGNGKAATTWIAVELLPKAHVINEIRSTKGGWRDSDLRGYLQETVYKAIPNDVRERLVKVKKEQYDGYELCYQKTDDLIWIPDTHEVIGDNSLYYGLFKNSLGKRIKQRNGSASWWWLRSAHNTNYFYNVSISGGDNSYPASYFGGVVIGFCL